MTLNLSIPVERIEEVSTAFLWDIGDGIGLIEFHSKMNTQNHESLQFILDSIDYASHHLSGLVIGNHGEHFCAGANVKMILDYSLENNFERIEQAVVLFQDVGKAIKYAPIPVVVSPHQLTLGGGCEFTMHSPRPLLSPDTYMGLVEVGVGLLPAGGGTKEMTLACSPHPKSNINAFGDTKGLALNRLVEKFTLLTQGKVSKNAEDAIALGYLNERTAIASTNYESDRLEQAKAEALALAHKEYFPPEKNPSCVALGEEAKGAFENIIETYKESGMALEHDVTIAKSIGYIMSGGPLSAGAIVTENYLLELEREQFMSLVGTKQTQERMKYMLENGTALRN